MNSPTASAAGSALRSAKSTAAEISARTRSSRLINVGTRPARRARLYKDRSVFSARAGKNPLGHGVDLIDVGAIDDLGGQTVRTRNIRKGAGAVFGRRRATAIPLQGRDAVVLHKEHHGQPPQLRDVERLGEHALLHGAIAKKDHSNFRVAKTARGKRGASGERNAATDDRRGVQNTEVRRRDVEAASPTLAVTVYATQDLGQDTAWLAASGQDMAVVAVGGKDAVPGVERGARARAGCLLADIHVDVATNRLGRVLGQADHGFFQPPDAEHGCQEVERLRHRLDLIGRA